MTEGGQLDVWRRRVLGRIMREDGDPVEGAVVLRIVQPALQAVRAVPPDPDADNVRGATATRTQLRYGSPRMV